MVQTGLERGSHPLGGTIFGAPLKLHWTFWFNFLFQVAYSVISFSSSWKYILLIAIIWGPFCLLMIYLHELGHLWVNRRYGGDCSLAVLWPLGGFSICCIEKCTCMQEFWVALAGPATHSVQFIIWVIVMSISSEWGTSYYNHGFNFSRFDNGGANDWFAEFAKQALDINMMICFLNLLLPVYPLDASRMLAALSVQCGMEVDKACLMLVITSGILGISSTIYGIVSLVAGTGYGLLFLFLGIFVLSTTFSMLDYYRKRRVAEHPLFQADCYTDRRTYAAGNNGGPTRTYTTGRADATNNGRKQNSDIETGQQSPRPSSTRKSVNKSPRTPARKSANPKRKAEKKITFKESLKKAKQMKLGQLKQECQKRGIHTASFKEKSDFEQAYAESF